MSLDPINILSDIESRTVDFLTSVNEKLFSQGDNNMNTNNSNNNLNNNSNNNNSFRNIHTYEQPNHIGKYLVNRNNETNNINTENNKDNKDDNVKGFTNYKDNNYNVEGFTNYTENFENNNNNNNNNKNNNNKNNNNNNNKNKNNNNNNNNKNNNNKLEESIEGYIKYVYDKLKSFFPKDKIEIFENIIFDENNMIPLGSLLIIISVVLFFISITS